MKKNCDKIINRGFSWKKSW